MELQNSRIDQLPQSSGPKPGFFLAMRNMELGITQRIEVDYFLTSTATQNFEWLTDHEYAIGEVVTRAGRWWQALQVNENIIPGTNPATWQEISKSASGFVYWQAGAFVDDEVFVLYNLGGQIGIYHLANATRPFVSSDFEDELANGDWEIISSGDAHYKGAFASEGALEAAHPAASPGDYAIVDTGGAEAQLFIWDDTDNDWVASGVTTVVPAWNDTTSGTVERSTQVEAEAIATQVAAGAVGALSAARAPSETGLFYLLVSFLTKALTWAAKQTFTSAPRFSSTTESQFLRVDANNDLESVAAATQAEMITGTNDTKPATPKSVEDKGSVKSRAISNSATGSTDIDCLNSQQVKAVYNTTVTGAITITKSNASNLEVLNIAIPITGSSIAITFPSDTRMERAQESLNWAQSTKTLTVSAIGTADIFEFSLMRVGSVFELRYGGPYRA